MLVDWIHGLVECIWTTLEMTEELLTAIMCPIFNKGCTRKCENYSGVSVLRVIYKVLAVSIANRAGLEDRIQKMFHESINVDSYETGLQRIIFSQ